MNYYRGEQRRDAINRGKVSKKLPATIIIKGVPSQALTKVPCVGKSSGGSRRFAEP